MGFLVIARRIHERILIGLDIEILVADIRKNQEGQWVADIAILAPGLKILRKELKVRDMKNGAHIRNQSG